MTRQWSTRDRPTGEQFSYWREVVCEAFAPLRPHPTGPDVGRVGIPGWVRSAGLRATNCAEIGSVTQRIDHGRAEVRRTRDEHVFVNLQLTGSCVGRQGGRECLVRPGGLALFDTTSEYRLDFAADERSREWQVVSFRLPRRALAGIVADPEAMTAVEHRGTGLAGVLVGTMRSIWQGIDDLGPAEAEAAETAFAALLAAQVGGSEELRDTRRDTLDATVRAGITRYLASHLRGHDLSPAAVARHAGISVRKLHALYAGGDRTFGQTVMDLRVDACVDELRAGTTRSLTELAARWGFSDLSHMNRVVRARRGAPPSDFRTAGGRDRAPSRP